MSLAPELSIRVTPLEPPLPMTSEISAPELAVGAGVLRSVKEHARAHRGIEVGGILLGDMAWSGTRLSVEVTVCLAAERSDSGLAHVTFTHESWRRLREQRCTRYPQSLVVGWYHTHPGFGVFLSPQDRILHQQLFERQPWCVALVVDPIREDHAFFWPARGKVVCCPATLIQSRSPEDDLAKGAPHGVPDTEGED